MGNFAGRNRRRNILSLPAAQLRIICLFAVLAILYATLNIYVSKRAFTQLANSALSLEIPTQARYDLQVIVCEQGATLDLQLSLFTFLSFCMVCLAGILLSHRLGGPVFHLKQYLDGLAAETIPPRFVHFRKGDFFHDLAETFNRFQVRKGWLKADAAAPTKGSDASA